MCNRLLNKSVVNIRRFGKASRLSAINDDKKRWQVISLGSTQILYALDFAFTPEINGQNLAFQVQPFLYDLKLLKRFAANVKPGGVVIIGVCPFSFCLYDFSSAMKKTHHYKRYDFIFKSGRLSHFLTKWKHSFMKKLYRFLTKNDPDTTVSEVPEDDPSSPNGIDWSADAEKWMNDYKKSFLAPPDYKELLPLDDVIQKNIGFVNEMINCTISAGLKPVLVLAPL